MNHKLSKWLGGAVKAKDGDMGKVEHFYFDDLTWTIRYMAVKTGDWLPDSSVLVSLEALGSPDWKNLVFPVNITKAQVRSSPHTEVDEPVSRQHEIELHEHYEWLGYWGSLYTPFEYEMLNGPTKKDMEEELAGEPSTGSTGSHIHRALEVVGCHVHASDGNIGHVEDFLVDDGTWAIRYLIVNTRNWLPGRHVLISPRWIEKMDWNRKKLFVDLTKDSVRKSPEYDPLKPFSVDYEQRLCDHFRRRAGMEWVLFKIKAPLHSKVYVAGTFNCWKPSSIRLSCNRAGIYTAMILLPEGRYEYRFIVNGVWCNSPHCHSLVPNSFGTQNSVLLVGQRQTHDAHLHTFSRLPAGNAQRQWGAMP